MSFLFLLWKGIKRLLRIDSPSPILCRSSELSRQPFRFFKSGFSYFRTWQSAQNFYLSYKNKSSKILGFLRPKIQIPVLKPKCSKRPRYALRKVSQRRRIFFRVLLSLHQWRLQYHSLNSKAPNNRTYTFPLEKDHNLTSFIRPFEAILKVILRSLKVI